VSFPHDYATAMRRMSDTVYNESSGLTTVFANDLAAASSQRPYPEGAVILMEFAQPVRDGEGKLLRDEHGVPLQCAACHRNAGTEKDFVFRKRPWLTH
jgi:hypothetical protein